MGIDDAVRLFGSIGPCEPFALGGLELRLSGIGFAGGGIGESGCSKVFGVPAGVFGEADPGCAGEICFSVDVAPGVGPEIDGTTSAGVGPGVGASVGVELPGKGGIAYVGLNEPPGSDGDGTT